MKQAAARQRVHADDRLGLVPRLEAKDRRQDKLVRASCEPLKRRQRIATAGQPLRLERRLNGRRRLDQAIAPRPGGAPARPSADDRPSQPVVEAEQVVGPALHSRRIPRIEQWPQRREVVLEIVDGPIRIGGSWPGQVRAGFLGGLRRERAVVWHAARHRAHRRRARKKTARARGFPPRRAADTTGRAARLQHRSRSSTAGARRSPRSSWQTRTESSAARPSSSSSGSSRGRCGTTRSARPGTKTTRKLRPRAWCGVPTNNRPYRRAGGSQSRATRRSCSTSRASSIVTGPTSAIGRNSASSRNTRSGRPSAPAASAENRSSHSPQVARSDHAASPSMMGIANWRRCDKFRRSRTKRAMRGDSGSSRSSSAMRYR